MILVFNIFKQDAQKAHATRVHIYNIETKTERGKGKTENGKGKGERGKGKTENGKRKACANEWVGACSHTQRQRGRALLATTEPLGLQRSATKSPHSQVSSAQSAVKAGKLRVSERKPSLLELLLWQRGLALLATTEPLGLQRNATRSPQSRFKHTFQTEGFTFSFHFSPFTWQSEDVLLRVCPKNLCSALSMTGGAGVNCYIIAFQFSLFTFQFSL